MKTERRFVFSNTYRAIIIGLILILSVSMSAQINPGEGDFVADSLCPATPPVCLSTDSFAKAQDAVNIALSLGDDLEAMKREVEALRASGREDEAYILYKDLLVKIDQIYSDAFCHQMHQIRTLNDLNDREKQARLLQTKEEEVVMSQHLLIFSGLILLLLLLILYILGRFYRRADRLKNELLADKESLVKSEQKLRRMKEKAVEANQLKTAFISNISHEVRTPLNAIVGFSGLLTDNSFGEEEKVGFASTINHSSELLMNLINDVLDLSRLEAGNITFTIRPVNLDEICQKAMEAIANKVAPAVRLTFDPGASNYMLNTDPYRLQQLLVHLLSNAAKFTREGEVNLAFSVDDEREEVRFVVTDSGCGIPHDMQAKIFEPFEKLNEFAQGTGLGLSICQIIVRRLNGKLFVDPSYTGGARFVFIHPTNHQEGTSVEELNS